MKLIFISGLCLALSATSGCRSVKGSNAASTPFTRGIVRDAWTTHAAYARAVNAERETSVGEIRSAYWAEGIRAMNPVRVYIHRVNIVVVQRVRDGTEEGKYIYIPVSSYLPQQGDDGFVFSPNPMKGDAYNLGDGVFDFERTRLRLPVDLNSSP